MNRISISISKELMSIKNVRGYIESNGTAMLNLEDVARGLGFTRVANSGNEVIRWQRVTGYLNELGMPTSGHDDIPIFIPENIFYRLAFKAKNKAAESFQALVCDEILPTIRRTGHYETKEYQAIIELKANQERLEKLLMDSGVLRTNVNPRHAFDRLNVRYKIATNDNNHRGLYDAIGNYFGVTVPYGGTINVTVKDWIIAKFGMDDIQDFIVGLESGMITKSAKGHYVNLNGFGSNNIEWPKILRSWDGVCAYCGDAGRALIPEHIVSQSYLACSDPESVDLIGNITCSCGPCNKAKGTLDVGEFFDNNPQLKRWRLSKIQKHQDKYRLEI